MYCETPHSQQPLSAYPLLLTLAHRVNKTCRILLIDSSLPVNAKFHVYPSSILHRLKVGLWYPGEPKSTKAASTN